MGNRAQAKLYFGFCFYNEEASLEPDVMPEEDEYGDREYFEDFYTKILNKNGLSDLLKIESNYVYDAAEHLVVAKECYFGTDWDSHLKIPEGVMAPEQRPEVIEALLKFAEAIGFTAPEIGFYICAGYL